MSTIFPYSGDWTVSACAPGPCGEKCVNQLFTVYGSFARGGETEYTYYPNPANETLTITYALVADGIAVKVISAEGERGTVSARLRDSTGNTVKTVSTEVFYADDGYYVSD